MKALLMLLGVVMFILGFLLGVYLNIFLLISAIVDIFHGGNIVWNVFLICIREVIGVIAIAICWFFGGALFSLAGKK